MQFNSYFTNVILRGYIAVREGNVSAFTLVIVILLEDYQVIYDSGRLLKLRQRIFQLLSEHPITGVIIGVVTESGEFEPLNYVKYDEPDK